MKIRIVDRTNSYVKEKETEFYRRNGDNSRYTLPKWVTKWRDIDLDELDVFLAVLMLKGVSHAGNEKSFWSTRPLLYRPIVSSLMSRNRFLDIKRALHCQDDSEEPESSLQVPKIGILLDMFLERAREMYIPGKNCSIDEMMLRFHGTSAMKFTAQAKPTSDVLKIFALCEAGTGYGYHRILDRRGKATIEEHVLQLVEKIKGHWRVVYMDNLFTSVHTLREMLKLCTYGAGTTRANL